MAQPPESFKSLHLLSAFCFLLTAYCLLPSAYCLPPPSLSNQLSPRLHLLAPVSRRRLPSWRLCPASQSKKKSPLPTARPHDRPAISCAPLPRFASLLRCGSVPIAPAKEP